jgi:hypothetical protein
VLLVSRGRNNKFEVHVKCNKGSETATITGIMSLDSERLQICLRGLVDNSVLYSYLLSLPSSIRVLRLLEILSVAPMHILSRILQATSERFKMMHATWLTSCMEPNGDL